jgi:hypothetical protein
VLNVIGKYSILNRLVQNHILHTLGITNFDWGLLLRDYKRPVSGSTGLSMSDTRDSDTLRVAMCTGHGADCGCQAALHKVHLRVHNSPKLIPIISWSHSDRAVPFDDCKTNLNISIAFRSRSLKCSLYFRFPYQNPVRTSFTLIHSTVPAHLNHLDLSPE